MAERDQKQPDLASALYPHLSREAKAQRARQAQAQAEQKMRSQKTAQHLQEAIDDLRREGKR
jgi:hypothetical protein